MMNFRISILECFAIIILTTLVMGCQSKSKIEPKKESLQNYILSETGLKYKVLKEGDGAVASSGDDVFIFETTSYRDGTLIYTNENSSNPIKITLGKNMVTKGVEEGLTGMRTGEIRELLVPHYLAKRKIYPDNVSPDSALVIKLILDRVIKTKSD